MVVVIVVADIVVQIAKTHLSIYSLSFLSSQGRIEMYSHILLML